MTTLNLFIAGQSFAIAMLKGPALAALTDEFLRAGITLNATGFTRDGSSILKANAPPTHSTWHWYDEDTGTAGPALTDCLAYIATLSPKPTRVIWQQGAADSVGPNPDAALFKTGTTFVVNAIKSALGTNPGVTTDIIGRRLTSSPPVPGVQIIREAQLDLIASGLYVFGFDTFDLPLLGEDPRYTGNAINSHMDPQGNAMMGFRGAQRMLQSVLAPNYRVAPYTGSISRSGDDVVVPIYGTTAFTHPMNPSHWAIRDDNGLMENLTFAWSGDTLTITPPRPLVSGRRLLNNYGDLNTLDRDGLIYDGNRQPLRSMSVAIP